MKSILYRPLLYGIIKGLLKIFGIFINFFKFKVSTNFWKFSVIYGDSLVIYGNLPDILWKLITSDWSIFTNQYWKVFLDRKAQAQQ